MSNRLTIKQQLWAEYYIITRNGTRAARMAGYKGTDDALAVVGSRNLRKPKIKAYIDERLRQLQMSADEVLFYLSQHAQGRVSDFMKPIEGTNLFAVDIDKVMERGHLIKKITMRKGQGIEIELHNPQTALKMLGEYHQLFTQKVKFDASQELLDAMRELGLSIDDIKSDPLASALFASAGVEVAGITKDAPASG